METALLNGTKKEDIAKAAVLLKAGGLVAIPTETVYGLAANALDGSAVKRIFKAKGRPQDNPLIVHIASLDTLPKLWPACRTRPLALADRFWPGPLTIILPKASCIPDEVSAGLETVAVRFPSHRWREPSSRQAACRWPPHRPIPPAVPAPPRPSMCSTTFMEKSKRWWTGATAVSGSNPPWFRWPGTGPGSCARAASPMSSSKRRLAPWRLIPAVTHAVQKNAVVSSPGMKYKH